MLAELPIFIVAPLLLQPKSNAVSGRVQAMLFSQTAPDAPSMASCSFVVARMDRNPESMSAVSRTWDWRTSVRQAPLSSCPGGPETILFGSTTVSRALANPGMPRFTATAEFLLATWATAMMRSSALIAVSSCDMLFTSPALSPSKSPSFNVADFTPTNCVLRARPRLRRSSPGRSRWRRVPAASRRWYSTTVRWSPGWYRPRSSPFHPRRECPAH